MKLLIVEDDENSRQLLIDFFQSHQYEVHSAQNGIVALSFLQLHPVDIVISDILMPEMDGYGLCRAVKQNLALQKIPFIFYTATYTSHQDERFALSLGASAFLIKPMDLDALKRIVDREASTEQKRHSATRGRGLYRATPIKVDKQHTDLIRGKLDKKVAELNKERKKLIESETRFRDFAEASADWFWEADHDLNIDVVSGGPFGVNVSNLKDLVSSCVNVPASEVLTSLHNHQKLSDLIIHHIDESKNHLYLRVSGKPIYDEENEFIGYRGVGKDVSDVVTLSRKVEFLATHDELTGLPNRNHFKTELPIAMQGALKANQQLLLLYIDIDHFKIINDTLGHEAGDQLLIMAAERIAQCARATDVLYRMGGDEFVMMIDAATPQDGHRLVREIVKAFSKPFEVKSQRIYTTVSIGVSVYPDDATDLQTLLSYADLAMYRAKKNGRNNFEFYTPTLNFTLDQTLDIEHGIQIALKKNSFHMVYQPQLDCTTNQVVGIEALLRWVHPDYGIIPTIDFIKVAEQTSLINQVDDWVLEEVCRQMQQWIAQGYYLPRVSVNISARHLRSDNLLQLLTDIPKKYQITPNMLCLEITEHAILEESAVVKTNMQAIKKAGFAISLDDFGTGHSSLLYLKRWDVDEVKIDRTFINDLVNSDEDRAIVKAMVALANALNLNLVGEGVENQQQADILLASGCRVIQGHYHFEPLESAKASAWLKKLN